MIGPIGTKHTKALHISFKCKVVIVVRVLIDNGSTLNVLSLVTFKQFSVDNSLIRPS